MLHIGPNRGNQKQGRRGGGEWRHCLWVNLPFKRFTTQLSWCRKIGLGFLLQWIAQVMYHLWGVAHATWNHDFIQQSLLAQQKPNTLSNLRLKNNKTMHTYPYRLPCPFYVYIRMPKWIREYVDLCPCQFVSEYPTFTQMDNTNEAYAATFFCQKC